MQQGETARFSPEVYLKERHPGWRIFEMRLPSGVQGCVDHEDRVIWLDSGLSPVARRSTLAFELGQLEHGPTPGDPRMAAAHRRAAAEWAALMLIPTSDFVDAWAGCLSLPEMAARCGVDLPTFRTRIRAATDADQDAAVWAIEQTRLSA